MVSGGKPQRKSPFTLHLSNYQHDLPRLMLLLTACLRRCLPGFSSVKLVFFSPLHSVFFEKKITVISPHLRREVLLHFTEEGYQLFGILLWRRLISYPPHMYWFDYLLYHYGLFIYLFYYLSEVIIQCYSILLFRIFQLWSLRVLLAISSAPLTILVLSYGFFFFLSMPYFLLLQVTSGSS